MIGGIALNSDYAYGLLGGALIGLAGSGMLLSIGRVMGVSGIIGGLLVPQKSETLWRALFVIGMLVGALLLYSTKAPYFKYEIDRSYLQMGTGGFLVGFGTLLGNGCTSGHGVCGVSRMSPRSLLSTCIFILAGVCVVFSINHFT